MQGLLQIDSEEKRIISQKVENNSVPHLMQSKALNAAFRQRKGDTSHLLSKEALLKDGCLDGRENEKNPWGMSLSPLIKGAAIPKEPESQKVEKFFSVQL